MDRVLQDMNGTPYDAGHVVNINQTVNGCSFFVITSVEPLRIHYYNNHEIGRRYEYDMVDLIAEPVKMPWLHDVEIIGQLREEKCEKCKAGFIPLDNMNFHCQTCQPCEPLNHQPPYTPQQVRLHEMYNATSTAMNNGELETYEHWLERQLIARLERIAVHEKALRGIKAQCPAPSELICISPKLTVIRSIATKALEELTIKNQKNEKSS